MTLSLNGRDSEGNYLAKAGDFLVHIPDSYNIPGSLVPKQQVIDNQIDLFTSNTSYSKFKQRYLSKLNSLNLEFGYESFRKLLIESKINLQ